MSVSLSPIPTPSAQTYIHQLSPQQELHNTFQSLHLITCIHHSLCSRQKQSFAVFGYCTGSLWYRRGLGIYVYDTLSGSLWLPNWVSSDLNSFKERCAARVV